MKISACLITRNEERNLPRALASLQGIVDEVVVVDSGSTDGTERVAKESGARFIPHDWEGYAVQKNFAISQATHPWVLSLDADEELDETLRQAIQALRKNPPQTFAPGYRVSRLVKYRGKWIWHGDWYPDRLVRLFQKDRARFAGGRVHERLEVEGVTQTHALPLLPGLLHHYTYENAEDRHRRMEEYARLWALSAHEQGRRANAIDPWLRAGARFMRGYLLRRGFLDGAIGWEVAAGNAREVFWKYRELRRMNKNAQSFP